MEHNEIVLKEKESMSISDWLKSIGLKDNEKLRQYEEIFQKEQYTNLEDIFKYPPTTDQLRSLGFPLMWANAMAKTFPQSPPQIILNNTTFIGDNTIVIDTLDKLVAELQKSVPDRVKFWPYSKIERWDDSKLEYSNLCSKIPIVGRETDENNIVTQIQDNFDLVFNQKLDPISYDDLSKVKQKVKQIIVTGAPGIGKTTMGLRIPSILDSKMKQKITTPIYLRASFSDAEADLSEKDKERIGSVILGMRLFWYFLFARQNKKYCWQAFQTDIDKIFFF